MAQDSIRNQANKHRKDVEFHARDHVWLSTANIKTKRPCKKLDFKWIGPYKIIKVKRGACKLKLPSTMRIHNVFHMSLLRKQATDPVGSQLFDEPPPIIINNERE